MLRWRSIKMSDENKINNNDNSGKNGDFRVPPKTWIVWIVIIGGILALVLFKNQMTPPVDSIKPAAFLSLVESNQIDSAVLNYSPQSPLYDISGKYRDPKTEALVPFHVKMALSDKMLDTIEANKSVEVKEQNTIVLSVMMTLLPILLIGAFIWFFFIRQIKMAGKGALSFGKSKARLLAKERNKTTFKDVAGIEEAIEEVSELVEFLKDPKKFQRLGGRIPKGVLMIGPPGTGKTLLAKAIAGEADAAFFSISGSDFVEMFVGVGASRVRDMFEQARKNTPCRKKKQKVPKRAKSEKKRR